MKKHTITTLPIALLLAAMIISGCVTPESGEATKTAKPTVALNTLDPSTVAKDDDSGYIYKWQILGPYSFEKKSYKKDEEGCQEALDDAFIDEKELLKTGVAGPANGDKKWVEFDATDLYGNVDLNSLFDDPDYVTAYCVAHLNSPKELKNCQLLLGSDDYIKVWVNGKKVYTYSKDLRAAYPDEDVVKGITINKGWNTIIVKSVDVYGGWGIFVKIANEKGQGIETK